MRESPLFREHLLEHRAKFVGIALLFVALSAQALTLGRIRGAALIGQPLDMVIPVQLDAGEDAASLCFSADVFHADSRQDAARVRVSVEPTAQALSVGVRVTSSAIIDEPVVTIYLRTGCGQKTTRRYVLLADLPSELAASPLPFVVPANLPPLARVAAVEPPATSASAAEQPDGAVAPSTRRASKVTASQAKAPRSDSAAEPAATPKAAPRPARRVIKEAATAARGADAATTRKKAGTGRARLKLDPLELLSDRVANLDSFMTFEPSEDALREREKVQKLEADVKALREAAARNQASVLDLRARLQKAEEQRFPSGLIYGLLGAVLLALLALGWYFYRQRQTRATGGDWWSGSSSMSLPATPEARSEHGAPISTQLMTREARMPARASAGATAAGAPAEGGSLSEVDVTLIDMSDSHFDDFMPGEVPTRAQRRSPGSDSAAVAAPAKAARELHSRAVLEARHQAEALAAVGKTDRAVSTLKKQISASEEPNPFVYLDLFGLMHSLGLKDDFAQLRQDFKLLFNGRVPDFAFFRDEGKGLEAYPEALARLTGLWGKPKVLDAIETLIFRDPWSERAQVFDLAAFRDLLLLHGVAHGAVLGASAPAGVSAFSGASPMPALGARDVVEARDTLPAPSDLAEPQAVQALVLDLDLSAFEVSRPPPSGPDRK